MKNNQYNVTSVHDQVLTLNPLSTGLRVYFTGTLDECKKHVRSVAFVNQCEASTYKGRSYKIREVSSITA